MIASPRTRQTPWIVAMLLLTTLGCRKIKNTLGMGEEVNDPKPGSYEAVIQQTLRAALIQDKAKSWESFVPLLHSQERSIPGSIANCKRTFWPAFRRKAAFLVKERSKLSFVIMEDRSGAQKGLRKVFVKNSASDKPTPIQVKRDPGQSNAWRIAHCSM